MGSTGATQIAHGDGGCISGGVGVPPRPGCRTHAISVPSRDHAGEVSREVDGAR